MLRIKQATPNRDTLGSLRASVSTYQIEWHSSQWASNFLRPKNPRRPCHATHPAPAPSRSRLYQRHHTFGLYQYADLSRRSTSEPLISQVTIWLCQWSQVSCVAICIIALHSLYIPCFLKWMNQGSSVDWSSGFSVVYFISHCLVNGSYQLLIRAAMSVIMMLIHVSCFDI